MFLAGLITHATVLKQLCSVEIILFRLSGREAAVGL